MKILADQNIPQVAAAFRDLGEVELMPGREIEALHLQDCHCLITRTVTRVDAALLQDTPVEFVGTATIGTDHIDLDYLADSDIGFSNAAGCNAEGASEYVISGLFALSRRKGFDPLQMRAGIVGLATSVHACGRNSTHSASNAWCATLRCRIQGNPARPSSTSIRSCGNVT